MSVFEKKGRKRNVGFAVAVVSNAIVFVFGSFIMFHNHWLTAGVAVVLPIDGNPGVSTVSVGVVA